MTKNLKFKVKNAQLAEALKLKKKVAPKKTTKKETQKPQESVETKSEVDATLNGEAVEAAEPVEKKPAKKATDMPSFMQEPKQESKTKAEETAEADEALEESAQETVEEEKATAFPPIAPKEDQVGYIRPGTDKLTLEKKRIEREAREKERAEAEKLAKAKEKLEGKTRPASEKSSSSESTDSSGRDRDKKKNTKLKEFKESKALKKFQQSRVFDARDRQGLRAGDDDRWRRRRGGKKQKTVAPEDIIRPKSLHVKLPISVKDLAADMKFKAAELIQKLFMQGAIVTINDMLDDETTVQLLGEEFGCTITIDTSEEERLNITDKTVAEEVAESPEDQLKERPPVITMMGHVDHGKTSLIDAFRKSNITAAEAGAITQHIGAFRCTTPEGKTITLLDTPGHEAFTSMRARGANLTDIIVLVVAGDEGIKPQTEEAIKLAQDAGCPMIVAINKCDKPGFNPDNVYRQLADLNLLPEAWGGTVSTVNCSAQTKEGLDDLLELVLLQAELLDLKANANYRARGVVLEAEVVKGMGNTATLLVQNGALHQKDALVMEHVWGRIKTMHDDRGRIVKKAAPGMPVKVTGISDLPDAGTEFIVVKNEKEARQLAKERTAVSKRQVKSIGTGGMGLESLLQTEATKHTKKYLNVIIKADVHGSIEAILSSLQEKIVTEKAEVNVIAADVGDISESDVERAAASGATILGFHTSVEMHAEPLIKQLQVNIESFDVIYHLIDRVKELLTGLLDKVRQETKMGEVRVQQIFKSSHLGIIAGCIVTDGIVKRSYYAKLIRDGEQVWEGDIGSLKRVQEDVKEVKKGLECGVILKDWRDIQDGDEIHAYEITYVPQTLED